MSVRARNVHEERHIKVTAFGSARPVWWLHPGFIALLLGVPFLIVAYLTPESTYLTLYRSPKVIDLEFVMVGMLIFLGFSVGSFFTTSTANDSQEKDALLYCRWFVNPLYFMTLFGYLAWFGSGVLTSGIGSILAGVNEILFSQEYGSSLKDELFPTIPGITTFTQVGMLYVTVETLLWVWRGSNRRYALLRLATIALFAVLRAILLSERLAVVELVVPMVVIFAATSSLSARNRNLLRLAPLLFGVVAYALFAAGEYFRSWKFFRPTYNGSYLQFAAERFMGYYTTAVNNAAVVFHYEPLHPLRHTAADLFEFPILGGFISTYYVAVFGDDAIYDILSLLAKHVNPEFNNVPITGLLINEFSLVLAPVAAFVLGVLSVSLYSGFLRGRLIGVLVYPSWYVGILEIPRLYYWAGPRYFPTMALLVITLFTFVLAKKYVRTPPPRRSSRGGRRLVGQRF